MRLDEIDVDLFVKDLESVRGVTRVFDRNGGNFKLSLAMPHKLPDIVAIVDVDQDEAYLDVDRTPENTPTGYLRVNEVMASYDLQPVYGNREIVKTTLTV